MSAAIGDRIQAVMRQHRLGLTRVAKAMGYAGPSQVNAHLKGRRGITRETLERYAHTLSQLTSTRIRPQDLDPTGLDTYDPEAPRRTPLDTPHSGGEDPALRFARESNHKIAAGGTADVRRDCETVARMMEYMSPDQRQRVIQLAGLIVGGVEIPLPEGSHRRPSSTGARRTRP